jgi:Right handed beta helix region
MRQLISLKKLALSLVVVLAACLVAATGHAASLRTWVSNAGSDSNPCSVTLPCLTFAGALANTSSGGEINCLTPGGFGVVTITISVTIDCEGASNGGITTNANAININTAGIIVNLIGLDINGENATGGNGLNITGAATVNVRNCKIYGFASGDGIIFNPGSSGGIMIVDNVLISGNYAGIGQLGSAGVSNMTVRNSNINNNNASAIGVLQTGGTHAGATIEQTTLAFNGSYGLYVQGSGAIAVIGSSTVVNNGTGVATSIGGILYSFKNNQIGGNSTDGTPLTAYPGGPLN